MRTFIKLSMALVAIAIFTACGKTAAGKNNAETTGASPEVILLDQVGYTPDASKIALVRADSVIFQVLDSQTGKMVFEGKTTKWKEWKYSGDKVSLADFSSVKIPGKYKLYLPDQKASSYEFVIGTGVYDALVKAATKAFYYNRCSYAITPEFGTKWARAAGHPDTEVIVHESAASKERPAGTKISSPGGWYDAGDYGKYIVNSSVTVYTMLLFYQAFPEYCENLKLDIPESNNNIPDFIDEVLFNFNWMLTMQDPNDGGVYHKLTTLKFDSFEMPEMDKGDRYVYYKSTAATLDFAAVTAMAARLFENDTHPELKALASQCLIASEKAMKWAQANPAVVFRNPKDVSTGEYGDDELSDELFWARAETALTANNASLLKADDFKGLRDTILGWGNVSMAGFWSLALTDKPEFKELKEAAIARVKNNADKLMKKYEKSAYRVSIDFFAWGSNSDVANEALQKIIAMKVTGDKSYLPAIQADLDYLLGRNATGYCFVTGIGTKPTMNIHHRPSGADGVVEPVPGFLAGGPNLVVPNDCGPTVKRSRYPAAAYSDLECSYSTNEIAINWNAPLIFVAGFLEQDKR
ncbi:MAG TPA: glycoside hydrolase family 9 protein [Bacteroidales bacterium]|nr:glycoside hydrolase family 9 protein [Bacteroidales bacterium]